jgi:ABC-type transport system substrate-binding protein
MLKAQRRTQDLAARKQIIFDIQRYEAEQQYYVYLYCPIYTGSYQLYVKNYAANALEEYGMAAAMLWLDR